MIKIETLYVSYLNIKVNLTGLYFIYVWRIYVDVDRKLMRQWKSTLTCLFHSFDQQLSKFLETMEERFTGEKSSIPTACLILLAHQ